MEIKRINIKGSQVGIVGLDDIFAELKKQYLTDENVLKQILLQRVKDQNYVPSSVEEDYKTALYREYKRFLGEEVEEEETGLVINKKLVSTGRVPNRNQLKEWLIETAKVVEKQNASR